MEKTIVLFCGFVFLLHRNLLLSVGYFFPLDLSTHIFGWKSISRTVSLHPASPAFIPPHLSALLALPNLTTCLQGQPECLGVSQPAASQILGRQPFGLTSNKTWRRDGGGGGTAALVSCRLVQDTDYTHRMGFSAYNTVLAMTLWTGEVCVWVCACV